MTGQLAETWAFAVCFTSSISLCITYPGKSCIFAPSGHASSELLVYYSLGYLLILPQLAKRSATMLPLLLFLLLFLARGTIKTQTSAIRAVYRMPPAFTSLGFSFIFILAASQSQVNAAKLNKPILNPSMGHIGPKLLPYLPVPKFEIQTWESGFVPESCKLKAETENRSSSDLVAFSVLYEDCHKVRVINHFPWGAVAIWGDPNRRIAVAMDILSTSGVAQQPARHGGTVRPHACQNA